MQVGTISNPVVVAPGRRPVVVDPETISFLASLADGGPRTVGDDEDSVASIQLLANLGIVAADGFACQQDAQPQYTPTLADLHLKRSVVSVQWLVSRLSRAVQLAASPAGVVTGVLLLIGALIYITLLAPTSDTVAPLLDHPVAVVLLAGAWSVLGAIPHEAGHFAVARQRGHNPEVGVGLYLTGPVLYTDLTCLELEAKQVRLRGDLAGVAVDGWLAAGLLALAGLFRSDLLHFLTLSHVMVSISNLRATEKYDGYWALRDLVDARSMSATWASPCALWTFLRHGSRSERRFSALLLVLYGGGLAYLGMTIPRWYGEVATQWQGRPDSVVTAVIVAAAYLLLLVAAVAIARRRLTRISQPTRL